MASINRIKSGDTVYDLVPQIGAGLQFGTSLTNENTVYINIGKARSDNASLPETGMSITPEGFIIDSAKFTAYLKALGFKTA